MNQSSNFTMFHLTTSSSGNNSYQLPFDEYGIIVAAITLLPMAIFGIFGNVLTIFVILKSPNLKSIFNLFIASLCLSDLLSAINSPLFLYRRTWGFLKWELPNFLCTVFWALDNATSVVTSFHILCFAGLRFISLLIPHSYSRIKEKHAKVCIISIWVGSMLSGFLPFAMWFDAIEIDRSINSRLRAWPACTLKIAWLSQFRAYTSIGYSLFFYIPMILIALLSASIALAILRRRRERQKKANAKNNTRDKDEAETKRQSKENQAMYQLTLIVGSFMMGYVPHTAFHIYSTYATVVTLEELRRHWWFGQTEYILLRFSESLNPVFYNMASTKMRRETFSCLRKLFGIKQKESEQDLGSIAAISKPTATTHI